MKRKDCKTTNSNYPAVPAHEQLWQMQVSFLPSEWPVFAEVDYHGTDGEYLRLRIRLHADGRTLVGYWFRIRPGGALLQFAVSGTMETAWRDIHAIMSRMRGSLSSFLELEDTCNEFRSRYKASRNAALTLQDVFNGMPDDDVIPQEVVDGDSLFQ